MPDIYGGLWFESLVAQDKHFVLQMDLFQKGLIQGVQIRVAHPSFTPGVTASSLPLIFGVLPEDLKLFFHFGAENVGVDLGENLDERGEFALRACGRSWAVWNLETLYWGLTVANFAKAGISKGFPLGVIHPGYGKYSGDSDAEDLICGLLKDFLPSSIALENVPPVVDKELSEREGIRIEYWNRYFYWGFGGTPGSMKTLLGRLGPDWRCLIDFTHLFAMKNQATARLPYVPEHLRNFDRAVRDFLDLSSCPVCHFSGLPPTLVDSHHYIAAPPIPVIREAIAGMEAVCLEIPFKPGTVFETIENFKKAYRL